MALLACGYYYSLYKNKAAFTQTGSTATPTPSSIITPTSTPAMPPQPTQSIKDTSIPSGWLTYKNSEYGFEISYPDNYDALDDKENLYGWPNGVVLLYKGGQAYDIAIEVWDNQSEYESKYPNNTNLTVKKIGDKYLTITDNTLEEENTKIISTFKITK